MIKLALNDIDGVIEKFIKPDFPKQQDVQPYKHNLEKVRKVIEEHAIKGIKHAACTGRSLYSIRPVLEFIGINAPSVFEHGTEIWIPGKGSYRLVEKEFPGLIPASNALEKWISEFDDERLFKHFPNIELIRRRKENTHILTYEFRGATAEEVFKVLETLMPKELRNFLREHKLKTLLSTTEIDRKPTGSIDVLPSIDKSDGVRHVLEIMGLKKEEVLGIEDSYHSGIPLLQETGFVAGPSNSQDKLKEYIKARNGYVSPLPHRDGYLDIMKYFFKTT